MRHFIFCSLFCLYFLAPNAFAQTYKALFPIQENGFWGYIDKTGKIIVPPQFDFAFDFSEGLAAFKKNNKYGYIDATGKIVIAPTYDHAMFFHHGLSRVRKDGKEYFIDKKERLAFENTYFDISFISGNRAYVKTAFGKVGMVDRKGNLVLDTIFQSISEFKDGVAIVENFTYDSDCYRCPNLIDTSGKLLLPIGKYKEIIPFRKSWLLPNELHLYIATFEENGKSKDYIINSKGQEVKIKTSGNYKIKKIQKNGTFQLEVKKPKALDLYILYDKLKDEVEWKKHPILKNSELIIIDEQEYLLTYAGEIESAFPLNYVKNSFRNGKFLIQKKKKWGMWTRFGDFIEDKRLRKLDDIIQIKEHLLLKIGVNYGYATADLQAVFSKMYDAVDLTNIEHGIMRVRDNGKLTYLNLKEEVIWESNQKQDICLISNIFGIEPFEYIAYSTKEILKEKKRAAEFVPKSTIDLENLPKLNSLFLYVDTSISKVTEECYDLPVFLGNTSKDTMLFKSYDKELFLKLQVIDNTGKWVDLQMYNYIFCGRPNQVELLPQEYWEFFAVKHNGTFNTKARLILKDCYTRQQKEPFQIVSNEFKLSIDPYYYQYIERNRLKFSYYKYLKWEGFD